MWKSVCGVRTPPGPLPCMPPPSRYGSGISASMPVRASSAASVDGALSSWRIAAMAGGMASMSAQYTFWCW